MPATRILTGADLIALERTRQWVEKGYTAEHDYRHDIGELASAAICYALAADCLANGSLMMGADYECTPESLLQNFKEDKFGGPISWPFEFEDLRISPDPIENLVKAGALIAAEIDRLRRLTPPVPAQAEG